ncbi:vitamin B12 transporter [Modicisalibacter ilicicola DSM 19980]|uniref:Vitamin B12 transporter n=1 Tax=Modicisalibacter ilicicola DSM 19980 TaxID=1121942 RepID=A0A1M4X5U1_9GAMM|nr:TonB-dependent receptor [Halomonas ilicicola]SHE88807.1 vitamin B12 transporter [Halomonas ilicicola DSM 19980]
MWYKKNTLWLAILAISASNQALAQQRLEDIQVTANRLPQSQADLLASTTIIEREEIERLQAASVIDLLQARAGVEITQNGPPGSVSSLFLRGSNSNHSVVLVDGVRANSAVDGRASLEFLDPSAIERIEIVRGPRAAIYGADAIGGVIQVFTRQGSRAGTQASLNTRVGGNDSHRQNLWIGTGNEDTRLNATVFNRETEGFNARTDDESGERDGFERHGAQLGLSHRFDEQVSASVSALRQDFEAEYDNCFRSGDFLAPGTNDCISDGYQQSFAGSLNATLRPHWDIELTAGHFDEVRREEYRGERQSRTATQRDEIGLQNRFYQDDGLIALGVDYRHERVDFWNRAGAEYARDSRENVGLYGLVERDYGLHQLTGSLRHDDDSLFGDETTGSLGYGYRLTPNQRLGASYATAFKAPSLSDLYGTFDPNPDLEAETAKNIEAFWEYRRAGFDTRVTAFQNRIDDLIVYTGGFLDGSYRNVDEARIRGVELSGGWQGQRLSTRLAVTFQDPEIRHWSDPFAGVEEGDRLLNRAERFARLDIDYDLSDGVEIGSTLRAYSERTSYGGTEVGGYGIVDLRAAWQVTPEVELSAKIENVLDKQYQLVDGYNTRDRYVEGGVTLRY